MLKVSYNLLYKSARHDCENDDNKTHVAKKMILIISVATGEISFDQNIKGEQHPT